jgi:hypothetical protein
LLRSRAIEARDLTAKIMAKTPKITCNCKSWVKMGLRCQSDDRSDHLPL